MRRRTLSVLLAAVGLLLPGARIVMPAEGPVISEFLAINNRTLEDEDGEHSDWIEITIAGSTAASLAGYSLTDRKDDPRKWLCPDVTLSAGESLLIFASGKHRVDPRFELHTNFRLDGLGEYLALIDPEGNVVVSFDPFPPQFADIAYGYSQARSEVVLLEEGAAVRAFVPTGDALGLEWTEPGFPDAGWVAGTTGAGFDVDGEYTPLIGLDLDGAMRNVNSSVYLRIPFTVSDPADLDRLLLRVKYDDGFAAYLNGQRVARRNTPLGLLWDSAATAEHGEAVEGSMAQDFDSPGTAYVLTQHSSSPAPVVRTGGPTGRYLHLMEDYSGNLVNTVGFQRTFGPANQITIEFDYRMSAEAGYTGNERADGFGVALLSTVEYGDSGPAPSLPGIVWERPSLPDAFSVGFDIYDGSRTENTVNLNWNGAEVAASKVTAFDLNTGEFHRVRVTISSEANESRVSVRITPDSLGTPGVPVTVFSNVRIPGMGPFDHRIGFGGRTGGEFTALDLDNISVDYVYGTPEISYETVDVSAGVGALEAGANVLAIHGLNLSAGDPDFLVFPTLEALDLGSLELSEPLFLPEPTPGMPNGEGFPGIAEGPLFSHGSGAYSSTFQLVLGPGGTTGATVRYTLDGTEPDETSTAYTTPILIDTTRVVKARSFKEGLFPSVTTEETYIRISPGLEDFSSNLPLAIVETYGRGIGSSAYTPVSSLFIDIFEGRSRITGVPSYSGSGGIQIRGSSSQGFPKKMYKFETWDAWDEDRDVPLLGFPAESDWVLYGPYSDKALMRNYLSYSWSNEIGRYAPRTRFFEMFLNTGGGAIQSSDYVGTYVLIEKIKRNDDRVDIKELLPSDDAEPRITGGYILKKDRLDPGDNGFLTSNGQRLAYVEPKEEEITPEQAFYIRGYLNQFEAALYGSDFRDPVVGYEAFIDVDSFIEHHILVEVTKNIDGFRLSTFMYKDRGKKLHMGPIWDYNLSLGNADYLNGWIPQGWYYPQLSSNDYPWYSRLFEDADFTQRYIDRWTELRRASFRTENLLGWVDATADHIWESQLRNFQTWNILGQYIWPNWYIANTYQEELDFMKGWIEDRVEWIDSVFPPTPVFNQEGGALPPGGLDLTISAPTGTVYFTRDGSDPRLEGGNLSPAAEEFGQGAQRTLIRANGPAPVRILVPSSGAQGLTWTEPGFNDGTWAGGTGGTGVGYEDGSGYETFIDWDVGAAMAGTATSVYIRFPFSLEDAGALSSLVMEIMYDDGFQAYLNGRPVASANAPLDPQWDSQATAQHDDAAAVAFETFNLTPDLDALRTGQNVLAIHGLNANTTSSDLLLRVQLTGGEAFIGDPIAITEPVQITARTRILGSWSGPTRHTFVDDVDVPLRVTELMYHPAPAEPESPYSREDFEFVELLNVGPVPVDPIGVLFEMGIEFEFPPDGVRSIAPGEYVVVVEDLEAFSHRYDTTGLVIAGQYRGNLSNAGEVLSLVDGRGVMIQEFPFDDLWLPETDGAGFSLHVADPTMPLEEWGLARSWRRSAEWGGSPGGAEPDDVPEGGWQLPGDYNQDASLDISDAVSLLGHLFLGSVPPPPCEGALTEDGGNRDLLDVSGDQGVDLSDAIHTLNFLFLSGLPPALGVDCVRIPGCPDACAPGG